MDKLTPLIHIYSHLNQSSFTAGDEQEVENEEFEQLLLRGLNVSHLRLANVSFIDCSLCYSLNYGSHFQGGKLINVCLIGARLAEVHFEKVTFENCNFNKGAIEKTSFEGCQLTKCCFCGLNLTQVDLEGSEFQECCHNNTRWPRGFKPPPPWKCHGLEKQPCHEYYPHP